MGALEATIVAVVLVMMLTFLFIGWKSPEIVVFLALVVVWNVGIISTSDAMSGFNNPGVLAVGSLFVVIKGVEKSRLADEAAQHVFGMQTSFTSGLLRLMGLAFFLSAFLNNTPVVALLIPITRDWARTRGFSAAQLLMPLSFSCIFGGLLTIIGTSTNLVVQGLVIEASAMDPNISGLGFFEPGYIGLPLGLIGMAYLVVAAPRILPGGRSQPVSGSNADSCSSEDFLTEVCITSDSELVGKPLPLVLGRLGLPAETLVTVRHERSDESPGERPRPPPVWKQEGFRFSDEGTRDDDENDNDEQEVMVMVSSGDREYFQSSRVRPPATADSGTGTIGQRRRCGKQPTDATECGSPRRNIKDSDCKPSGEDSLPSNPESRSRAGWNMVASIAEHTDSFQVSSLELVQAYDSLVLRCSRSMMVEFQGSIISRGVRGLRVLDGKELRLVEQCSSFYEVVLSDTNKCIGSIPSSDERDALATCYGCRVVAVRHPLAPTDTQEELEIDSMVDFKSPMKMDGQGRARGHEGDAKGVNARGEGFKVVQATQRPLSPGDIAMVLASEDFMKKWRNSEDFDFVAAAGALPEPVRIYDYMALLVFCGMLSWVLFSSVIMVRAAFAAGGALIVGGWVDPKKAVGYVDWALLLLVGSALGLSKAIANSGLAGYAGAAIRESGMSPSVSLYVLYGFTMMCTELITNNAAAALAVPVALSIAQELEVSYKPFVVTVMMAASSSFITPIGYQTNTMVWGPGGYKFSDFIRLGAPLSILNLLIGSSLMPMIFPF